MPAAVLLLLGLGFLFEVWGITALMFWPGSSLKGVFKRSCNEKMVLLTLGLESVFLILLIWFQEVWTCRQNNYFQEYKYQYWYTNLSIEYQFQECLLSVGYSKVNQIEMADEALRVLQSKISSRFLDIFMTKLVPRLSTRPLHEQCGLGLQNFILKGRTVMVFPIVKAILHHFLQIFGDIFLFQCFWIWFLSW